MLAIGLLWVYLLHTKEETINLFVILQHESGNPPGEIGTAFGAHLHAVRGSAPRPRRSAAGLARSRPVALSAFGGARTLEELRKLPYYEAEKDLLKTIVRRALPLGRLLGRAAPHARVWRSGVALAAGASGVGAGS